MRKNYPTAMRMDRTAGIIINIFYNEYRDIQLRMLKLYFDIRDWIFCYVTIL